ncbi:uncharacterized protein LOC109543327 [Dendroctonus ponderosae]|uniref:Uncharacterized protein n=1 Tax=Dendroctonus ponderosae TaxID=77166 RepID=A0AAR5Q604_DENPD|nr:uncharacterized protein LOC109543327 [Dendroctonus ponderosae]KAH1002703.1 hypothetical protein HUJ04_008765 [Dendroctonus ponderosae]KAH1008708.1 hypothetical protein HUJ05_009241 [Dendroctonus ponderosae]
MGQSAVTLILVFALITCLKQVAAGDGKTISANELKTILAAIPEAERDGFIRSNIELGYKIEQRKQPWEDEKSGKLAVQIFRYFLDIKRNSKAVFKSLKAADVICYPDPIGCIDSDDSGIRPI